MEIGEGRFPPEYNPATGLQRSTAAPDHHGWQVVMKMAVAVGEACAVDEHQVVEQSAVAFLQRGKPSDPRTEVGHVVFVDLRHPRELVALPSMVRQRMVPV